jgi:hypothetical protein
MMAVVDNDIVLKGACYRLLPDVCGGGTELAPSEIGILSSCRYVVTDRISRDEGLQDAAGALLALAEFLESVTVLDPTEDEQRLAADLEFGAQGLGLPLDAGESQLCAVVVERSIPALLTGDKRAIVAVEELLETYGWLTSICGRVRCLEQLVYSLMSQIGLDATRVSICSEPGADTALDICFSCNDEDVGEASVRECLSSYIQYLRTQAPRVLAD